MPDLRTLFARANEEKSGDQLAGLGARSEEERVTAKRALAETTLEHIAGNPLIDPATDDVSCLILETHDAKGFAAIRSLSVGEFREFILDDKTTETDLRRLHWAITPEMAAAVAKIMSNKDLVLAANKIRVVTRCRNTMGQRGVLGIRLQPNHPADDTAGILLSAFDGLLYGCGDAVIGVNPATDSVETVSTILHALSRLMEAYRIPTQSCCLAHISTQLAALDRGAPVDLLFQSVAGTQKANESFGVTLSMLKEGRERVLDHHRENISPRRHGGTESANSDSKSAADDKSGTNGVLADGSSSEPNQDQPGVLNSRRLRASVVDVPQVMYFETGQGSALSAEAHHGVDQLTLEARAYGVARVFEPFLVNSVVGFIGPEYLYDERQIIRAGLEDHFMGKLLGLPMGCDVCYTNHAAADQNSADNLLMLLAAAGCNYFMGVPCADDVMLNYQSTSFHDALAVRRLFGLRPAPEFFVWLEEMGIYKGGEPAVLDSGLRRQLVGKLGKALVE
ncbi:MAG TPA: ethanolamine ammonia-lyase subunit EutB [Candidatus Angelobacter sp.]|nr:ethanolamine ammonia-lyase subunit EutB [Candidatus Angelobacter sp.]